MPTAVHPRLRRDIEADLAEYAHQAQHADADGYPEIHETIDRLLDDWQATRAVKPSDVLGKPVHAKPTR